MYQTITKNDSKTHQQVIRETILKNNVQQIKPNRPMERPMVEQGLRIRRRSVRFPAEGSLIPKPSFYEKVIERWNREGGDHTRLEARRPCENIV